ncbi:hypothetical protein [Flavobacterium sp. '19STA2R22 D10 B1']|uniref:hypothetical protein n=1 Tax=Flavobacterium aerium TaxID=3037261 RepID=UPI00278C8BB3|nr:hypothetical protein [Flavobacterium sp. '19STA2R22 D10 B1']
MKTISLLFLVVFLGKGCNSDLKKEKDSISIEYEAASRGSYYKVLAKQDTIITINDRKMKNVEKNKLSTAEWNSIVKLLEEVDLSKLNEFKAPTEKRFYDGAAIAAVKVIYKDQTYTSDSFDDGHPPVEIEKVVKRLLALSTEKSEKKE